MSCELGWLALVPLFSWAMVHMLVHTLGDAWLLSEDLLHFPINKGDQAYKNRVLQDLVLIKLCCEFDHWNFYDMA